MDSNQVKKLIAEGKIKYINIYFVHLVGLIAESRKTTIQIDDLLAGKLKKVEVMQFFNFSYNAPMYPIMKYGIGDTYISVDESSFRKFPSSSNESLACIAIQHNKAGKLHPVQAKGILKQFISKLNQDYSFSANAELSFHIIQDPQNIQPLYSINDKVQETYQKVTNTLVEMDLCLIASEKDRPTSRITYFYESADVEKLCDDLIYSKIVTKNVFQQENYLATFLVQPFCSVSSPSKGRFSFEFILRDKQGVNLFSDQSSKTSQLLGKGYSYLLECFLGGVVGQLLSCYGLYCFTLSSYREARSVETYGIDDDSKLVNVMMTSDGPSLKFNLMNSDANFHLGVSAFLKSGIWGISNPQTEIPLKVTLPYGYLETANHLKNSEFIAKEFGEEFQEGLQNILLNELEMFEKSFINNLNKIESRDYLINV